VNHRRKPCPDCLETVALNGDGRYRRHPTIAWAKRCKGSGQRAFEPVTHAFLDLCGDLARGAVVA